MTTERFNNEPLIRLLCWAKAQGNTLAEDALTQYSNEMRHNFWFIEHDEYGHIYYTISDQNPADKD